MGIASAGQLLFLNGMETGIYYSDNYFNTYRLFLREKDGHY